MNAGVPPAQPHPTAPSHAPRISRQVKNSVSRAVPPGPHHRPQGRPGLGVTAETQPLINVDPGEEAGNRADHRHQEETEHRSHAGVRPRRRVEGPATGAPARQQSTYRRRQKQYERAAHQDRPGGGPRVHQRPPQNRRPHEPRPGHPGDQHAPQADHDHGPDRQELPHSHGPRVPQGPEPRRSAGQRLKPATQQLSAGSGRAGPEPAHQPGVPR